MCTKLQLLSWNRICKGSFKITPFDYARTLSFYYDFINIGSPKRDLEPNDDQSVQGEPKTKRLRQSELAKPIECPECGRLFLDAIRLKQHQQLHTSDAQLLAWLG